MRPQGRPCLVSHNKERDSILIAMEYHWRTLRYVFKGRKSGMCSDLPYDLTQGSILPA